VLRLLIATTSPDKIAEIARVLAGLDLVIETLADHPGIEVPDETGPTFADNARLKARHYASATGRLAVADDSGLEIDALGGAPGVQSARFLSPDATYPERVAAILRRLDERPASDRTARFVAAVAVADDEQIVFEATGRVDGRIADAARGTDGFGYDPIFFYPDYGRTLAEVTRDEKTAVSHRGQAFRKVRTFLEAHLRDPRR